MRADVFGCIILCSGLFLIGVALGATGRLLGWW
jgi:hypothetical protein